jgi:hypothetical protein
MPPGLRRRFLSNSAALSDPTTALAALPLLILGFIALVSFVRGCIGIVPS